MAVAFSPDGSTVLTGSSDGTARLWVVDTPLLVAEATRRLCQLNAFSEEELTQTIPARSGGGLMRSRR